LRDIEKLLAECPDEDFSRLNFEPRIYQYRTAKNQMREAPLYHMTHDGFALLAMGFTGKQALQWKIDFLTAFRNMETALKQQTERRANALRFLRPHWLAIEQGVAAGLPRKAICAQTGHRSPNSITANKRRMRDAGLLN
jgi:Rha family phage regulatory protein